MVSATWANAGRDSVIGAAARAAGRWLQRRRRQVAAFLVIAVRFVLVVAALSLFTVAAWMLAVPAGLAVAAVSCLVLEWAVKRR